MVGMDNKREREREKEKESGTPRWQPDWMMIMKTLKARSLKRTYISAFIISVLSGLKWIVLSPNYDCRPHIHRLSTIITTIISFSVQDFSFIYSYTPLLHYANHSCKQGFNSCHYQIKYLPVPESGAIFVNRRLLLHESGWSLLICQSC